MKWFFELGNRYAKESNWVDFALTKFCLCAVGIVIGILIPESWRTCVLIFSIIVFVLTYVVLMCKVFLVNRKMRAEKKDANLRNII